jgi:hypothetical protein
LNCARDGGGRQQGGGSNRAGAEEDGLGLLGDDAQVGDGEFAAGAEDAAAGQRHLLVEEDGLAGHESERAREVVLVQVRRGARGGGAKSGRGRDEGLLKVAEPWLRADAAHVDPQHDCAEEDQGEEEEVPAEDRLDLRHESVRLAGGWENGGGVLGGLVVELGVDCVLLSLDRGFHGRGFRERNRPRSNRDCRCRDGDDKEHSGEVCHMVELFPDITTFQPLFSCTLYTVNGV